jgi:hypothetical protein
LKLPATRSHRTAAMLQPAWSSGFPSRCSILLRLLKKIERVHGRIPEPAPRPCSAGRKSVSQFCVA